MFDDVFNRGDDILSEYDYKNGLSRILEILNNKLEVKDSPELPAIENLTFDNAYSSWVSAIFVDIRNSTSLFTLEEKVKVSKIIRCFTSEIIEILRNDSNLREIGIRGDCVYGIYTTPDKKDIYECADKTIWINTYMKMLNKILSNRKYPEIKAGIGMGTAEELIVKAGRKGVGINNAVWIGKAVTNAANLSSVANKNGYAPIAYSDCAYSNFIKKMCKVNSEKDVESWFTMKQAAELGAFYCADIIKDDFYNWIETDMHDVGLFESLLIR